MTGEHTCVVPAQRDATPTEIVLIEPDPMIRQALSLALTDEGFAVGAAASSDEAITRLDPRRRQLVVLDLLLPGNDGLSACRALRSHSDIPIIVVTAGTGRHEQTAALEAGADDYLVKPLVAAELAVRVRALTRHQPARCYRHPEHDGKPSAHRVRLGEIELLPEHALVLLSNNPVRLTHTEAALLLELAGAGGQILTRGYLLQRIWGYDELGDPRLLEIHMQRLRRKLENNPDAPELLLTAPGIGYHTPHPPALDTPPTKEATPTPAPNNHRGG